MRFIATSLNISDIVYPSSISKFHEIAMRIQFALNPEDYSQYNEYRNKCIAKSKLLEVSSDRRKRKTDRKERRTRRTILKKEEKEEKKKKKKAEKAMKVKR